MPFQGLISLPRAGLGPLIGQQQARCAHQEPFSSWHGRDLPATPPDVCSSSISGPRLDQSLLFPRPSARVLAPPAHRLPHARPAARPTRRRRLRWSADATIYVRFWMYCGRDMLAVSLSAIDPISDIAFRVGRPLDIFPRRVRSPNPLKRCV
jgi:hypothetical protein